MCTEPDQCRRQATTIFLSLNQSFTDGVACFRRSQNFDQRKPAVAVANPNEAQGFFGLGQGRLREGLDPRFGCQKLSAGLRDLEFEIGTGNCFPRRRGAKPRFGSGDVSLVAITQWKRDRNPHEKRLVSTFLEPSDSGGYCRIRNAERAFPGDRGIRGLAFGTGDLKS